MRKNVESDEALLRALVSAGILALAIRRRNPVWFLVSAMFASTAVTRRCAVNALFEGRGARERFGIFGTEEEPAPTLH